MKIIEKEVTYLSANSYSVLNALTPSTKNVWMVFHGIGHLSRNFLHHFDHLPREENYIIAPEAPSRYYLDPRYRRIGASWLTREGTAREAGNVLRYIDMVYEAEKIPSGPRLIVLGFSQGVSVATRWVALHRIPCDLLVLYAGGIPDDLQPGAFDFLPGHSEVKLVAGDRDPLFTGERVQAENKKIKRLFTKGAKVRIFQGAHEMNKELIDQLA